jgi:hypothetical protein
MKKPLLGRTKKAKTPTRGDIEQMEKDIAAKNIPTALDPRQKIDPNLEIRSINEGMPIVQDPIPEFIPNPAFKQEVPEPTVPEPIEEPDPIPDPVREDYIDEAIEPIEQTNEAKTLSIDDVMVSVEDTIEAINVELMKVKRIISQIRRSL